MILRNRTLSKYEDIATQADTFGASFRFEGSAIHGNIFPHSQYW